MLKKYVSPQVTKLGSLYAVTNSTSRGRYNDQGGMDLTNMGLG